MALPQTSIPDMLNQSRAIMTNPAVTTFEQYEKRGTITQAMIYISIASVITGLLGAYAGAGGIIFGVIGSIVNFLAFTALVFYIGQKIANGTGTWDEVAYTFSLFIAPLTVLKGVLGLIVWMLALIPFLGGLFAIMGFFAFVIVLLIQAYFTYIAVQSSMNIHDSTNSIITLVLAVVGTMLVNVIVSGIFGVIF